MSIASKINGLNDTIKEQNAVIRAYQQKQAETTAAKTLLKTSIAQLQQMFPNYDSNRLEIETAEFKTVTQTELNKGTMVNFIHLLSSHITVMMKNTQALRTELNAIIEATDSSDILDDFAKLMAQAEQDGASNPTSSFRSPTPATFTPTRPVTPPVASSTLASRPAALPPTPPSAGDIKPAKSEDRPPAPKKTAEGKTAPKKTDTVSGAFAKAQKIMSSS